MIKLSVQHFNSRSSVLFWSVTALFRKSSWWTNCASQSCWMQWSSQIIWNSFSMHCGENTRGSYPKWVSLVSRWEEQRRLSSYQWTWIFFFLSLEVFKRKTDVSAEHRMSTFGITSNLSESMPWRAEDPPKSARVKLNFFSQRIEELP